MSTESGPERLADALDAFLARPPAVGDEATADWLRRHEDVAEYLEPMLRRPDGPAPPPPRPLPGSDVGPYRLIRELGRGGMGVVYEALEQPAGRRVALKLLPETRAWSPQAIARFRREAAAAARLDHPGIVRVLGSGEAGAVHWIAMELVAGRSLRDALLDVRAASDGDPTAVPHGARLGVCPGSRYADEVVELAAQLAEALAHAHEAGVVHRDVKPQNVLIDPEGRARLCDFGLARGVDDLTLTRSGDLAGTPHYASPEQIAGRATALDGRSDLFSLGVVLYELLAMVRPFDGESTAAVLDAIRGAAPRPLRAVVPDLARGLDVLVQRLLEKDPARRPASARAVAEDLRALQRGDVVRTRAIPRRVLAARFVARHRVAVLAGALAAVVAIGVPTGIAVHLHRTRAAVAAEQAVTARHYARARQTVADLLQEVAAGDLDTAPGMQELRLRLFEQARHNFAALRAERPDDAEVALLLARATGGVGEALFELGRTGRSLPEFDAAIAAFDALPEPLAGSFAVRFELAGRLVDRAAARELVGDPERADADLARGLTALDALLGGAEPGEARRLRVAIARTETRFAGLRSLRTPDRARGHLARARAAWQHVEPAAPWVEAERAHTDLIDAWLRAAAGELDSGHALAERAAQALEALGPERSVRLQMLRAVADTTRAWIATLRGDGAGAAAATGRALAHLDPLVAADPSAIGPRQLRVRALIHAAERLVRGGDAAAAAPLVAGVAADLDAIAALEPALRSLQTDRLSVAMLDAAMLHATRPADTAAIEARLDDGERALAALGGIRAAGPIELSTCGALCGNHARWLLGLAPTRDLPRAFELLGRAIRLQRAALERAKHFAPARAALWTHLRLRTAAAFALRQREDALAASDAAAALAGTAEDALGVVDTLLRAGERDRAAATFRAFAERDLLSARDLRGDPRVAALRDHEDLADLERREPR